MATPSPRRPRMALLLALGLGLLAPGAPVLSGAGPATAAAPAAHAAAGGQLHLLGSKWGDKQADGEALAGGKVNKPEQDPGSLYTRHRRHRRPQALEAHRPAGPPAHRRRRDGRPARLRRRGGARARRSPARSCCGPDLSPSGADPRQRGRVRARHLHGRPDRRPRPEAVKADGKPGDLADSGPQVQQGTRPRRDAALPQARRTPTGRPRCRPSSPACTGVVQHRHDNGMDVRVVNLSFGATASGPTATTRSPPPSRRRGQPGSSSSPPPATTARAPAALADPALDPYVLAVGSTDPLGKARPAGDTPDRRLVQQPRDRRAAPRPAWPPAGRWSACACPGSSRRRREPAGAGRRRHLRPAVPRLGHQRGRRRHQRRRGAAAAGAPRAHPGPGQGRARPGRPTRSRTRASSTPAPGQVDVERALDALDKKDDKLGHPHRRADLPAVDGPRRPRPRPR